MSRLVSLLGIFTAAFGMYTQPAQALLVAWLAADGVNTPTCGTPDEPCGTFSAALSNTDPAGEIRCMGELHVVNIVINKPITFDCEGGLVLGFADDVAIAITINEATYPDGVVTLRNPTVDGFETNPDTGSLDGIRFTGGGAALHVENCKILDFGQQGIDFRPTSSLDLFVRDTIISNNAGGGILVQPVTAAAVRGSLSNVSLDRNGVFGLTVNKASGTAAAITVEGTQVEKNAVGLRANGASSFIVLTAATIAHNTVGLEVVSGGKIVSSGNNTINLNGTNGAPTSAVPLK